MKRRLLALTALILILALVLPSAGLAAGRRISATATGAQMKNLRTDLSNWPAFASSLMIIDYCISLQGTERETALKYALATGCVIMRNADASVVRTFLVDDTSDFTVLTWRSSNPDYIEIETMPDINTDAGSAAFSAYFKETSESFTVEAEEQQSTLQIVLDFLNGK